MSVFVDRRRRVGVTWARVFGAGAVGVVVLGGVVMGGYEAGWWFKANNVNREAQTIRNGYANQQALRQRITANFTTITMIDSELAQQPSNAEELAAQQKAVENQVCQFAEQITGDPLPGDQARWVTDHCVLGAYR